jgi:D-alanyl-D-alanine carboxypeptidase
MRVLRRRIPSQFRIVLTLAVGLVAACSNDNAIGPSGNGLQRLVDSLANAHDLPGLVVGVRRAGEEPSVIASGRADLASGRRMAPVDRFRIASLTKPMVATVILQLADEGRLSLDDTLSRFVPDGLADGDGITLRQLLNHTSGVADYLDDQGFIDAVVAQPDRVWTPQELIAIANAMPRSFAPGAAGRWEYSNTNYVLLGLVAEVAGGEPIGTLLQRRVFNSLGMTSTYFSTQTTLVAPFAQGYADLGGLSDVPVGTVLSPTVAGAAGAVVSNASDLLRFVEALAAGALISAASHAARLTTVSASRLRFPGDSFDFEYGLGVLVGNGWVGHDGSIAGYEAEAYAKAGVGSLVVLVNKSTADFAVLPIAITLRNRTFGQR